jgi:hypothetical protein
MKLFKIIAISLPVLITSFFFFNKILNRNVNPVSQQNDFYSKVDNALQTSQLSPIQFQVRDYQNQVEFYLENQDNNYCKVILSTEKDPYWQVSSLQDFFKTAKINNKQIKLVNLSVDHPYATFKNN